MVTSLCSAPGPGSRCVCPGTAASPACRCVRKAHRPPLQKAVRSPPRDDPHRLPLPHPALRGLGAHPGCEHQARGPHWKCKKERLGTSPHAPHPSGVPSRGMPCGSHPAWFRFIHVSVYWRPTIRPPDHPPTHPPFTHHSIIHPPSTHLSTWLPVRLSLAVLGTWRLHLGSGPRGQACDCVLVLPGSFLLPSLVGWRRQEVYYLSPPRYGVVNAQGRDRLWPETS